MTDQSTPKRLGINCKSRKTGEGKEVLSVGIHLETFIEQFKDKVNSTGWVNFGIIALEGENHLGYTHKPILFSK